MVVEEIKTAILVIWALTHLTFALFSIWHEVKYFRYRGWKFDNDDVMEMIVCSLCFGVINWIACCITYEIKREKKSWKITQWFNKLVEKRCHTKKKN